MTIFEVVWPGTWLDYEDRDWAWKIDGQLMSLQDFFFEANVALNYFVDARSSSPSIGMEFHESDRKRRSEISQEIRQRDEAQGIYSRASMENNMFETDVIFKREKWAEGRLPQAFEHSVPFMYARAFLYAVDAFDKFLKVLSKEEGVPAEVGELRKRLADYFPDLREVRNTIQHLEDRSRGLDNKKKPMVVRGLILSTLMDSSYGSTMADGRYGSIEVTADSMQKLSEILHEVLSCFKWRGPKKHWPM